METLSRVVRVLSMCAASDGSRIAIVTCIRIIGPISKYSGGHEKSKRMSFGNAPAKQGGTGVTIVEFTA